MEHRREPMGGEVGSNDERIGPDWANNNPAVDARNQSTDSAYNEQFVDSLTLRVRSLLSNWDDYEPQHHVPQRNVNLASVSSSIDYGQFSFGRSRSVASFDDNSNVDNRREAIEGEISSSDQSTMAQKTSMVIQASIGLSQQFELGGRRIVGPFLGNLSPNTYRQEVEGEISAQSQASRTSKIIQGSQANVSKTIDTRQPFFDQNLMARTSSTGNPREEVEGEYLAGSQFNLSRKSSQTSKGNQAMVSTTIDTRQSLFDGNLTARNSSVGSPREEIEGETSVENQPSRISNIPNVSDIRQSLFDINLNTRTSSTGSIREEIEGEISDGNQINVVGKASRSSKENLAKVSAPIDSRQCLFDPNSKARSSSVDSRREEVEGETSAAEPAKTFKSSSFVFERQFQPQDSFQQQSSRLERSDNFPGFGNLSSQNQQLPRISSNEKERDDLISGESQTTSGLNSARAGPSLSYVDFSQELQNRFNRGRNQDHKSASHSASNKPSLKKSCMFDSNSEQHLDSYTGPNQAGLSQHLGLPPESLENEAERSWSEITVRAESFMQPYDVLTKGKLLDRGSTNVCKGQNVRTSRTTSTKDTATKMSKFIGVDPRTSTRIPSNLNYPIVDDSNQTSTIAADAKTSRSVVSSNSKRTARVPVNQIDDSVLTSNPRIVVGCNVAADNAILNPVQSNITALDSRFQGSAASGSSSPDDFNPKPKGSIDRQRSSPFNISTNNKMALQDTLVSESRQLAGESAGDNSSLNATDFNATKFDRAYLSRNIRQIDLLSQNVGHFENVPSSRDTRCGDFVDRRENLVIAFRPGFMEGDGESPNLIQLDDSPTGISQEPIPASIPPSRVGSRASMDDWRINLFGRDPPRDPYDLDDPSERETPPLSASSMASSSRRLEWDNGADIGYSIAILRPTRVIPDVARSDPEGISLMNDTLNMGGASPFPYFSFGSVSNSSNFVMDQGNETMADASSQISIQSSGSQSLSDSRKSVIYNSVRDMRRCPWTASKSLSSTNGSPRLQRRSFRNLSCPELTDLRRDWLTRNDFLVSKSEEALKTYIFPGLVAQRLSGQRNPPFGVGRSSSIELEDRQNKGDILTGSSQGSSFQNVSHDVVVSADPFLDMPQGHKANNTKALPINQPPTHYYDRGDVPTERSEMHVCKNCQGPIHLAAEQISQNEDHFHTEIEESDYYPPYEGDPMSPTIEWTNPETYVHEFARPILVVSNNASKLEGRTDLSKIVGSFFGSQDTDNSGGHSEVKPHIRWYPFTPNQDIKDVSTQTSVSFVAQQQSKDAVTTRAVFAQQTSCPDESIVEPDVFGLPEKQGSGNVYNLQGDSNKFSQVSGIRGKNDSDSREVSGVSASETQTVAQQSPSIRSSRTPSLSSVFLMPDNSLQSNILNERNIPGETNSNVQGIFGASTTEAKSLNRNTSSQAYSHRSSSICNLESEFLLPENLQVSRGSNSQENDSQTTGTGQTCVSCHTDINASDDHESRVVPSSKDRLQQTMTTNSQNSLNAYYSSNTENNSTVDMEQLVSLFSERPSASVSSSGVALMNPRGERKLGVGECQGNSSIRQNNSTTAKSLFVQESLSTNTEKFPVQKSSNTRNLVAAVDQRSAIQQGSEGNLTDENFQRNFVRTSINTLNTFQDLVATGSRISIPGSNVRTIQASNVNNTKDLTHLENNLSSNVNLQRGSIRESHNISSNKTTYSTDIKNNIPYNINTQRVKVNEIQAATGNRTRNTSNFNNNLSSNAGHMIQSRFPASATNLLDFLSSNRPFSDSKYLEQKEGIPKSFSDPLIAGPQSDSSSEEDSGLVTFRSHAYEESSAGPNPQSVGYQPRQDLQKEEHFKSHGSNSPEVLFQGSTNYVLQEESVAFTNQNVLPTEIQNPKRSGNSQQSFIASQQVNQSTSMKDASVDAIRKEYEGQSRSNSLSPHRGLSLGKLESEDFISHQISSRKQGNFSDAATSPINVGSLSLHFPQASTNKIEDSSDTNTWRMREHILRKISVDSQIQTDTDKHYQRPPYKHSSTLPKDSSGIRHKEHERRHKELEIRQPEHEMRHQGSANRLQEHESKHQEPEIRHQEHQIRHKQHQIRHRKHEIRHQEHESKHQEPEIRHQEHQIRHKQHQIRHQEHEIRHRELEMKHQGQEVRLQGHENRQQEHQIEHKQPDNRHQELETRHQQPKLRHQEPEMRHQQPDYRNQATDIRYTTGHPNDRGRIVDREIGSPKLSASYSQTQSELDDILLQLQENLRHIKQSNDFLMPQNSRYEMDPETINSKSQQDCPKQDGGRSRTSSTSYSVKDDSLKQTTFRPRSGSNSFQHRDLYSAKRDPLAPSNQNFASVGIQVSSEYSQGKNLESEKCSFCNQSKASHPIQCPKREAFKVVLGRALDKGKGTSYCVYSNACKCCCDKTLQEAFNFHRAEIIERIEARQKEVETKTTKSLFLNLASPATSQQKSNKTKPKPSSDKPVSVNRLQSNKENIKKNSRNYSTPHYSNSSKQRSRQKNLNKYNQVMCKIYSQRLKSEILKGKVNFSRHEVLMNT